MTSRRTNPPDQPEGRRQRAPTPEGRENQLIAMAYDLAEQQIKDKTVSAQVLSQFIKAGGPREKLERERISRENELLAAKKEMMDAAKRIEDLYANAIEAMRSYAPTPTDKNYDD